MLGDSDEIDLTDPLRDAESAWTSERYEVGQVIRGEIGELYAEPPPFLDYPRFDFTPRTAEPEEADRTWPLSPDVSDLGRWEPSDTEVFGYLLAVALLILVAAGLWSVT